MIELGKKYQTRDGRAVEILRNNVKNHDFPVVGIITERDGGETQDRWTAEGWYHDPITGRDSRDLIPAPTKHEGWCVFYNGLPYIFKTKEDAAHQAKVECSHDPKIVAHVTWEDS